MNLDSDTVKDYIEDATILNENMNVEIARHIVSADRNHMGVVVGDDKILRGVISQSDITDAQDLKSKLDQTLSEAGLHTKEEHVIKCTPDEIIREVVVRMNSAHVNKCVVVDKGNRVIGIITRQGLQQSYNREVRIRL